MLRDLLKDGGLYTLANLLTKGIGLLLIPFYTVYFSTAEYGVRDILMVFGLFAGNFFSLQLNQGLARYVAEPTLDSNVKKQYASTATFAVVILFTIFSVICFVFSQQITDLLSSSYQIPIHTFRIAAGTIFFNNIFYFLNVYLRFLRQSKTVSILSFSHAIFGVTLVFFFAFYLDLGIDSVFLPFVIIVPLLICVQLYFLKEHLMFYFNSTYLKTLLKYSIPMMGSALSLVTMNFTDRVFINEILGADSLGIYSLGSQFASIIGIVIVGFGAAMGPIILEKHNRANTRKELERFFVLFVGFGTFGAIALSLFSSEITTIFSGVNYQSAYTVMPMLFFTILFTGLHMFSPGMIIHMKTKTIAILTFLFALLNIALNYFFVPKWGVIGAASSTLIATGLYQVIYFAFAQKNYPFRLQLNKVIIVVASIIAILVTTYYLPLLPITSAIIVKSSLLVLFFILVYNVLIKQYFSFKSILK
ncbi:MAG: lipopolysaccharide biosynthesis protein [Crocinitomicaceae bacterium]